MPELFPLHPHAPAIRLPPKALALSIGLVLCSTAQADCTTAAPQAGQTVTCNAQAPNPFTDAITATDQAGITVTIEAGAQLLRATAAPALSLTNAGNHSVTVSGTVTQQTGNAVVLDGGKLTHHGQIHADNGIAVVFNGQTGSIIENHGTISGKTGISTGSGVDTLNMHGGAITGGVLQGAGQDSIYLYDGTIDYIDQGDDDDGLIITGGTVTGDVQQGNGRDLFIMDGGSIGSLHQGDGTDSFLMTGGTIQGAFEDGDYAEMTGGTIGRVNMKLEDNVFDMSGGTIQGNLVTGFGNDTIILRDGYIGGNISVSGGEDRVTITGGTVRGEIRLSVGNDILDWHDGGVVHGLIDLGEGDDSMRLTNLNQSHLGNTKAFEAATGNDVTVLSNVKTRDMSRFTGWESIALTNDTEILFDNVLTLGDAETGTGVLNIDQTSSIFASGTAGAVSAAVAGRAASVINAGRIDLSYNGTPGDIFTINGNYTGNDAALYLNTVLAGDGAASDRLVINAGQASGFTGLGIINAGGQGALTVADGILVVQATNGATTAPDAFALYNSLSAGAYQYLLFKGGASPDTAENWYLRSIVQSPEPPVIPNPPLQPSPPIAPAPPDEQGPTPPVLPPAPPLPETPDPDPSEPEPAPPLPPPAPPPVAPPTPPTIPKPPQPIPPTPPTPGAVLPSDPNVPIYRIETPAYAVVPSLLRTLGQASLGTFHERLGEQRILDGQGGIRATWFRLLGNSEDQRWYGDARTSFKGDLQGLQAGIDLYANGEGSVRHQIGLFGGRNRASGKISGRALGWDNVQVGQTRIDDNHVGLSWSMVGEKAGYVDAILLYSDYRGDAVSTRNLGIDIRGDGLTASLEAGKPLLQFGQSTWWLEPQVQIIWQQQDLDSTQDRFALLDFHSDDAVTGRIGLRLASDRNLADNGWQPYFKLNYWKTFSGQDTVNFNVTPIRNGQSTTAWEAGFGVVGHLNRNASAFAVIDYTRDMEDRHRERKSFEANIGVRVDW